MEISLPSLNIHFDEAVMWFTNL